MSVWLAMLIGAGIGIIITTLILSNTRNGRIKAEYEQYIAELELEHQQALAQAQKRSVNTSRAVLKGKMAEQFAPILPEFQYLQQAIAQAIKEGKVRFETLRIDFED